MKRLLPFIFLILLLLAGILSVPFLLNPERHRKEITDTLSKLLKHPVVIGPISMGYIPPTLHLEQVAVRNDLGNPTLQIGSVLAPLDLTALMHLQFAPEEIEISHWSLTVLRKPDGHWDTEDWFANASALANAKTWSLRQVRSKEGEIHWMDSYAKSPQELVLSSVEGHWDPRPENLDMRGTFSGTAAGTRMSLSAKGQFFSSPAWVGDLQLSDQGNTAAFHVNKSSGAVDINGKSERWLFANALSFVKFYGRGLVSSLDSSSPFALENWQIHILAQKTRLTFEHTAGLSGGLSEVKGSVDKGSTGLMARAEIAVRDIPVETALGLAGEKVPLDGKLTMVVKGFEATLSSSTSASVSGEGFSELKEGHYHLPDSSVNKLAKAKTTAYIKSKFPDLGQKGLPLTLLSAHWKAKSGMVTIDDGLFVSTDIKAGAVGKIDLAKEGVDAYLRIDLREKDPKKLRLIPIKYHSQPAYGRLQGTFVDWILRAVPGSKVPAATSRKLSHAVKGK